MTPLPDFMRPARPADHAAIDHILRAAFGGPDEADLVTNLRAAGAMELELVMTADETPVCHLALSRMAAPAGWLALAPVAVDPHGLKHCPELLSRQINTRIAGILARLSELCDRLNRGRRPSCGG